MRRLRAKYQAWKRNQRSLTRYAIVPAGNRITAAGLQSQSRVIEIREQVML